MMIIGIITDCSLVELLLYGCSVYLQRITTTL